jgi:hypothetical protein
MYKQIVACTLVVTGLCTAALAQEPGAPESAAPTEEDKLAVLPEFIAIDANEDGMIDQPEADTLAEVLKEEYSLEFQFAAVDRSEDGLINVREYVAYDAALAERLGIA